MADPGYTQMPDEPEEEYVQRTPAQPYTPGASDHVWSGESCVRCSTSRTGPRAVLPCPHVGYSHA